MPAPLSIDLRKRLIKAIEAEKLSIAKAARRFLVSYDFANDLWERYQETGSLEPKKVGGNKQPKVDLAGEERIKSWLLTEPDLTLQALCERYQQEVGVSMGVSSMARALKRMGMSFKKKSVYDSRKYSEEHQEKKRVYLTEIAQIEQDRLIFIDETGANLDLTPPYGRSPKGQRVYDEKPTSKGQRISMVGAMSSSGMKTALNFEGTMTTEVFLYFLQHFLCPLLKAGDVVVMDNASVHKNDDIRNLIEATGAKLLFLPPYSPEMNPIELACNKIKLFLRQQKARTIEALYLAYANALKLISEHDANGFFKHAMSFAI